MLFPHNESKTHNLGDNYKQQLEKGALTRYKDKYEKQAIDFLLKTGTGLDIKRLFIEEKEHGAMMRYHVTIFKLYQKAAQEKEIFPYFYQSVAATAKGEQLTPYSVLAYASMYAYNYYQNADEVYDEFGEMKPSQAQAQAIADESQHINKILNEFYTSEELELLAEIR